MTKSESPLVLVDGSSYLFRAYHALPPLTNSQGEPTGAMYGVINMFRRLCKDYPDSQIIVIFDTKGKNFRHQLYPDYKANRPEMPEELACQIQPIHDIIRAMGLPLLAIEGVEADDVIGTLAAQATEHGMDAVISTGDKDMAQLVNKHITLVNTMTGVVQDETGVVDKFGVKPDQIVDYLALMGDKVDNVPGVDKVGPKTAVKWLKQYGSLAEIIKNADEIGGKVGENLRSSLDFLPLAQELVTIKQDVAGLPALNQIKMQEQDDSALLPLISRYEFKTWLAEMQAKENGENNDISTQNLSYSIILTEDDFALWLTKLKQATLFAFDTETTSLDERMAELVGLSFAVDAGEAAYVPLAHTYENAPKQLDREWVLTQLKPLLESISVLKVGQNLKYDRNVLLKYGIELDGIGFDTMLESYVFNSTATRHDMDSLADHYLQLKTIKYEEIAGKGAKQVTFDAISIENAGPYAAEDADITWQLHQTLWPQIEQISGLKRVFCDIEMPLLTVLARMEQTGVLVDAKLLADQSQELEQKITQLTEQAYKVAGQEFNLASPKQLREILFEQLQLPVLKKTPTGQASTAEEVMQELAHEYELPALILEHRSLSKLKSTYTDKLPEQINPNTGRVHTSYHQAVAATGRLSSSDPNLQNIPVRTEEGRRVRQAFIAKPNHKIVALDYSQIELRIMAHLSQDASLLAAFRDNLDVHRATAAEVFAVALDEVTSEQRRRAKAINFGLIYGMSAFGLAKQLGLERAEAQTYVDTYFARYPGVKNYMEETRVIAHQQGYVETLFGRRLYLPEINAKNQMRQKAAERTAINAPMQGTAADIIKQAMIKIDAWLQKQGVDTVMIMQVHDELVFEVPESELEQVIDPIKDFMEQSTELSVPLVVDIGVGENWQQAH